MEQYLTRKKANAPKYAEVPEVSFPAHLRS